ncbi:MAG: glycine rich domain-containing protein [Bacilli bacterium]|nr:glycine rich domain-containing protein [Bacilli bacterium]
MIVAVPSVNEMINKSKIKAKDTQIKLIEKAAKVWALDNYKNLSKYSGYYVSVSNLITEKYIDRSEILDPTDNDKKLDQCVYISYDLVTKGYNYKYLNCTDNTVPEAEITMEKATSNSIAVNMVCTDIESIITKYEFSIDNGTTWINNNLLNTYTFTNLVKETEYTIIGRCTNSANKTITKDIVSTTGSINNPTIVQVSQIPDNTVYATNRTIEVTYDNTNVKIPIYYIKSSVSATTILNEIIGVCGTNTLPSSCTAGTVTSMINNTWYKVKGPSIDVTYIEDGILYALTSDSKNSSSTSTYTVANMDNEKPTVAVNLTGTTANITLTDNYRLTGYKVTTTNTTPSTWDTIDNLSTTIKTFNAPSANTYYVFVKDEANNMNQATFTVEESAFCPYSVGNTWTYNYTGGIQSFNNSTCAGNYKLEVWGAQGGATAVSTGGAGGYSVGNINIANNTTLYVVVGGSGNTGLYNSTVDPIGGYNGGANGDSQNITASDSSYGGSGGGATHIAKVTGTLASIGYTSGVTNGNLLIVAGGGGAAGAKYGWPAPSYSFTHTGWNGGVGGGTTGGDGTGTLSMYYGLGGTQSAAGASTYGGVGGFGAGGASVYYGGGGGGGLFGGGAAMHLDHLVVVQDI